MIKPPQRGVDKNSIVCYYSLMSQHMQVATIILEQLRAGRVGRNSGKYVMMCWGTHDLQAHPPRKRTDGALSFRVQGRKFKGEVMIELATDDTYTIKLDTETKLTGIYFDQLAEVIDSLVETD